MQDALPVDFEPVDLDVVGLVVSPRHRFDGRPSDGPRPAMGSDRQTSVDVRAHKGVVGDRYFGTRHRFAAVTFLAVEEVARVGASLDAPGLDPFLARRNVLTRGLDVESLVHSEFTLEQGGRSLTFRSLTRANPCAWMDVVLAPGAHQAMRGHAGIRSEPLDDGVLSVGPARLVAVRHLSPDDAAQLRREALATARRQG
ncbi:molybdenum cofactor biosysynthesis protein [Aeromicrobium sp. REDSEA-S32_B7]|uniref:molybdenum cofactor biosysynthesis protein n=1 Tax=Aeromicrobium sp. REDSEA-S32_B7 TaxID=1811526 RepID=UPI000A48BA19|nr:molybdenum cofactor biosysynthesis protein [Aeromicrobium sp. REDSEA-S32_B7]